MRLRSRALSRTGRTGAALMVPTVLPVFVICLFSAALAGAICSALCSTDARAQTLKGSTRSVDRQNHVARQHDYTYIRNPRQLRSFVQQGYLVRLRGSADYELSGVSFPYARPEVKLFVERLSRQYHAATGEKLIVTSLTRPQTHQPRNASRYSVHPCGMAVDIRKSRSRRAQRWLEGVLLTLEKRGVVEATKERRPAHYHVAVFPSQYSGYVAAKAPSTRKYRVREGDSLWDIARKHKTTVSLIQRVNRISSATIFPGQVLKVPAR